LSKKIIVFAAVFAVVVIGLSFYLSGLTGGGVDAGAVFSEGFDAGYVQGYGNGTLDASRGFNIRDPTYQEVLDFVSSDGTERGVYNSFSYNCFDFCSTFLGNAFDAGWRCGFVYVEFEDGAHSVVCFDTVDRGLVFVEPQNDEFVDLVVDGVYDFVEAPNVVWSLKIIW
jgi:hypothetical protein